MGCCGLAPDAAAIAVTGFLPPTLEEAGGVDPWALWPVLRKKSVTL